jgi:hypothetical protein
LICKISGGVLSIRCPRCGVWREVALVDLVKATVAEIPVNGKASDGTRIFL